MLRGSTPLGTAKLRRRAGVARSQTRGEVGSSSLSVATNKPGIVVIGSAIALVGISSFHIGEEIAGSTPVSTARP